MVCLAVLSFEDMRNYTLPDVWILALACAGFYTGFSFGAAMIPLAVFGLVAAACAVLGADMPLGAGDAKLFAAIGLIAGTEGLAAACVAACLSAGAAAFILLILGKKNKKDRIPFGPFISFGFMLYLASTSAI